MTTASSTGLQNSYLQVEFTLNADLTTPEAFEIIAKRERQTADILNTKETARYQLQETQTGQLWFPGSTKQQRSGFRKVISCGTITAGSTNIFNVGVSNITFYTKIYGFGKSIGTFRTLPYVSATDVLAQIEVYVDGQNLTIISGVNAVDITNCYVVLEYLKT